MKRAASNLVVLAMFTAVAPLALAQCVPVPTPIDSYSGTDGGVYCSVVFDDGTGPALYLGGSFTLAGNTSAAGIVKWDGQKFVALGTGSGRQVLSMVVDGNSLLAGGGGTSAALRRWQGGAWTTVGPTFTGNSQINVIRVAADGTYAGVRQGTGSGLVVLRNGVWEPVGGGVTGEVRALEQIGDRWIAGGAITHVGGTAGIDVNSIAQWDGTQWSALGAGLDGTVYAIAVRNNEIYAGGNFESSEGRAVTCVGKFDGTRWQEVGRGLEGPVFSLTQIDGNLVATGAFTQSGDTPLDHLAKFEGGDWKPIVNGVNGEIWTVAQFNGKLHAGGTFTGAEGKLVLRVAAVSNGHWSGLSTGADGAISGMTKFNDQLIVSGSFSHIDGVAVRRMAAFNGNGWSQFGSDTRFSANCFFNLDGQLLAGGAFSIPGGPSGAARFNGTTWDAMGVLEGNVKGFHVNGGQLYAYGYGLLRQAPGGTPTFGLAKWDGTNWVNGFPGANRTVSVNGLANFNGRLYMSGESGGTLVGVYDLSGAEPVAVSALLGTGSQAITVFNGSMYAAGGTRMMAWNGTAATTIQTSQIQVSQSVVEKFVVHAGQVYAIGWFPNGSSSVATTVLRIVDGPLNGKTAIAAAVGSFQPTTTGQSYGSRLYVGGSFKFTGASATASNSSAFLASLACRCVADFNNDTVLDNFDYLDFVQQFAAGSVTADINTDGAVDFFDYLDFVDAFTQGC